MYSIAAAAALRRSNTQARQRRGSWTSRWRSLTFVGSLCLATAAPAAVDSLIAADRHVIVKDACAWPMLTTMPDNTIVAIIHNQPSHGQQEGQIEAWATRDGVTWERRGFPAPNDPRTVRMNVAAGLARNGDLLVICSGWTDEKQPGREKRPAFREFTLEAWVCRSKDGGHTWTQQKHFVPARAGWLDYIPFGPIIVGEDGALHTSCYSGELIDAKAGIKPKHYDAFHFRSDDDGVTWRPTSLIATKHSEVALFHLGGKRWQAAARSGQTSIFESSDDGETWSGPEVVSDRSQVPAHLLRLKDGRILVSYGSRLPDRLGVFGRLSSDNGKTWAEPFQIAAMLDWDGGYPSSAQRPDGKVITAYYAKKTAAHDGYHMAVAIWDPANASGSVAAMKPVDIGSRWELLVDDFLVAQRKGTALKLHEPVKREIVLVTDKPWEGASSGYFAAIQDAGKVRLYYRGSNMGSDRSEDQVTCVAESTDGISFTRPRVGLIEAGGTRDNNVVWRGVESHNFAPFLDANPAAKPNERYKALGGLKEPGKNWATGDTPGGLYAFASPDGLRWHKIRPEPVMNKGSFDSQNLAFWDAPNQRYAAYTRIFTNRIRDIQSSHSPDFLQWSPPVGNRYAEGVPVEHFYTSATVACPTAPHLLVSFPKRFVPERKKIASHTHKGVSDAVFMTSRDGIHWDRTFLEAWIRPGLDQKNWTDRNTMTAHGIIETSPTEWSLYVTEHYRSADHRIRRVTVRKQGFASMNATAHGGEFVTKPLKFSGDRLLLNYATSAAGSIRVEILDAAGKAIPGFSLEEMPELFGDEIAAPATWKSGANLKSLAGRVVRLRFVMRDADLFALRFAGEGEASL